MTSVKMQIGGRVVMLSPKQAHNVQKQIEINRTKSRRIERELKELRLGPADEGSQLRGWLGSPYNANEVTHIAPASKQGNGWAVKSNNEKFEEFLALNGKEASKLPERF